MTAVMTFPPTPSVSPSSPSVLADAAPPVERATPIWHVSRVTVLFVVILGLLFLFLNLRRLPLTDLWIHLAQGRAIVASEALPATEPLLPLAAGVPIVDTAWLTEVLGYRAIKQWGFASMQFGGALAITLMCALVLYRAYQRSRSLDVSLAGMVLFVWGCWSPLGIVRSQLVGLLCFVVLLTIVTSRQRRAWQWCAVPLLFALWANLDGSFPAGLALLASLAVGRMFDVLIRDGRACAVWRDSRVRRNVLMTELAVAATLLNPYGLRIYGEALSLANHPNAVGLMEWEPLNLQKMAGLVAALIAAQLMMLYRFSPRRVSSVEVLWLFGFGAAGMWSSRLLVWWVPVATYCFVLHCSPVLKAWMFARGKTSRPSPRSGRWSVLALGLIFCFAAATPLGARIVLGKSHSPKLSGMVSAQTPWGIVQHLHKLTSENRMPTGQVFHPHEWGDFLLWAGPQPLQVFGTSQPYAIPREVWSDYLSIINGTFDWESQLDRYGVNLVVLDDQQHYKLIEQFAKNEHWQQTYSDSVGAVFVRRRPI